MEYVIQFNAGLLILVLFLLFDKNTVRIQWDSLAKFLAFIVVVILFRISLFSYSGDIPSIPPELDRPVWPFALVFWEDAFFVLPLFFLNKIKCLSKWYIWYPVAIALSINFGLGHAYQGVLAVFEAGLYVTLVSYRYGKKVGMGTVMLAHIIYDFSTFYTIKYIWFFI